MMPLWRLIRSFTQALLHHTVPLTEPPACADTKGQLSATVPPPAPQVSRSPEPTEGGQDYGWVRIITASYNWRLILIDSVIIFVGNHNIVLTKSPVEQSDDQVINKPLG